MNKATSLIVVATALPFRAATVPFSEIGAHWSVIVNLLAGSLLGAYAGAEWATRLKTETLYRVIAVLLVIIAGILLLAHDTTTAAPAFTGSLQVAAGIVAGFVIGVIASVLGVAGGEFLIPTLVLLFGAEIKLAGSLSLAVSCPRCLSASPALAVLKASMCCGRTGLSSRSWPSDRWLGPSSAVGPVGHRSRPMILLPMLAAILAYFGR